MNGAGVLAFLLSAPIDPGRLAINRAYRAGKAWGSGRLIVRKSAQYRSARAELGELVMLEAARTGFTPLAGPLSVAVTAFWGSAWASGPAASLARGDVDAPVKGVLDSLEEGGVFADDAQVVEITVKKRVDRANPRILIWVYALL